MPTADPSRRRFLHVLARTTGAAAGALALGACGPTRIPAGNIVDIEEGALRVVSTSFVAIGRDEGGLYAMKLICTHAGCDISRQGAVSPDGISCDCHGSRFDRDGVATLGPAVQPLEHCAIEIDDLGNLTILVDAVVDVYWRLPVSDV